MEQKILKLLSHILSPPAIAAATAVIFSTLSPNIILSAILGVFLLAIIPSLPFLYLLKKRLTYADIRSRKARVAVLAAAVVCYIASSAVFYYLDYHSMFAISLAYLFVTAVVMMNNFFWKISVHAAGIAVPTTALVFVFGIWLVPLYVFTAAVFYARLKLKAHTLAQLFGGAAVGTVITFLTYLVFY